MSHRRNDVFLIVRLIVRADRSCPSRRTHTGVYYCRVNTPYESDSIGVTVPRSQTSSADIITANRIGLSRFCTVINI